MKYTTNGLGIYCSSIELALYDSLFKGIETLKQIKQYDDIAIFTDDLLEPRPPNFAVFCCYYLPYQNNISDILVFFDADYATIKDLSANKKNIYKYSIESGLQTLYNKEEKQ